ncbi:hypothetical protein [uncultured Paraglaciecola sp.]|uniref:hypothetical protein n=1 Tax=uncultured Paraglaciecola sp. TaxID=1765024 RepID=UPI00259341F0|nr:hypothetical protein [uncultured Paraglaciecola sp.]
MTTTARALRECKGVASNDEIQKLISNNELERHFIESIQAHASFCSGLIEVKTTWELNEWELAICKVKMMCNQNIMGAYIEYYNDSAILYEIRKKSEIIADAITNKDRELQELFENHN